MPIKAAVPVLIALLPCVSCGAELANLVRQAVSSGAPASGQITGKSAQQIVAITKARGKLSATVEVLGPLPTPSEVCRQVRIAIHLPRVETKQGTLVSYSQTLDMPWCPSAAGYAALQGTPGLFRVGK